MHVRERQKLFMFYVGCVQHIHIIYYNIYTFGYKNMQYGQFREQSLTWNHILLSFGVKGKGRWENKLPQCSQQGAPSVFLKEDGLSSAFGPTSEEIQLCWSCFLFSLVCNCFWWWSWGRTNSRHFQVQVILHHGWCQKER